MTDRYCSHGKRGDDWCEACENPTPETLSDDRVKDIMRQLSQPTNAEIELLCADVLRYRWLRDNGHIKFLTYGAEVDRIVDAEMAKPQPDPGDIQF